MADYLDSAKAEIGKWENEKPSWLANVGDFVLAPAQKVAEALIPEAAQSAVTKAIESFLLGTSRTAEFTSDPAAIRERVRQRVGSTRPKPGEQLEAADLEAQSCWNWHLGYCAVEGATIGATGLLGLAADIPALFTLVFRMVQQIGTCYGFDVARPEERDYVLSIVQVGSSADLRARTASLITLKQVEMQLLRLSWKKMAARAAAGEVGTVTAITGLRQFAKSIGANITKRKALQSVPVIGALIGASFNTVYANSIGRAAYMSFRRRWLLDQEATRSKKRRPTKKNPPSSPRKKATRPAATE